jgi:putative membrane protein
MAQCQPASLSGNRWIFGGSVIEMKKPRAGMKAFFIRWVITTIAVLAASHVVKGIGYDRLDALLAASLMLGFANAFLKPILMLLSLPFVVVTFGLFTIVINALLFWMVGSVVHGFHVDGFWSAFWGSLVVSLVTIVLKSLQKERSSMKSPPNMYRPPPSSGNGGSGEGGGGSGRVIDV